MKVRDIQQAIDFTVTDIYRKKVVLLDFKSKKIHFSFFQLAKQISSRISPLPLVGGPRRNIYTLYGVEPLIY